MTSNSSTNTPMPRTTGVFTFTGKRGRNSSQVFLSETSVGEGDTHGVRHPGHGCASPQQTVRWQEEKTSPREPLFLARACPALPKCPRSSLPSHFTGGRRGTKCPGPRAWPRARLPHPTCPPARSSLVLARLSPQPARLALPETLKAAASTSGHFRSMVACTAELRVIKESAEGSGGRFPEMEFWLKCPDSGPLCGDPGGGGQALCCVTAGHGGCRACAWSWPTPRLSHQLVTF